MQAYNKHHNNDQCPISISITFKPPEYQKFFHLKEWMNDSMNDSNKSCEINSDRYTSTVQATEHMFIVPVATSN